MTLSQTNLVFSQILWLSDYKFISRELWFRKPVKPRLTVWSSRKHLWLCVPSSSGRYQLKNTLNSPLKDFQTTYAAWIQATNPYTSSYKPLQWQVVVTYTLPWEILLPLPYKTLEKTACGLGYSSVVKYIPCLHKALGLIPSTGGKKKDTGKMSCLHKGYFQVHLLIKNISL